MKIYSNNSVFSKCLCMGLFALSIFVVASWAFLGNMRDKDDTSALTYKTKEEVSFTFSPVISIGVSSSTIDIPTLAPGTTAESDPITVTVATNTAYGYSLYADVGNSTDYNTTSLIHEDDINNEGESDALPSIFASIDTGASLPSLTTDNTWGYSFKPSTESTWSAYNGLPLYSTTDGHTSTNNPALLIDIKNAGDNSKSIDFKIAARSSATQPSGTYSNVINFYAVGKVKPVTIDDLTYMQDFKNLNATDKETVYQYMLVGKQYKLIDNRDNNTYWLAKQADGNIWMTQNLDLCIGCEGTEILTSQNTDINISGSGAYIDGYTNDGEKIIWSPSTTAITSNHPINGTVVTGWEEDLEIPYSAEKGETYVYTSNSTDGDFIYNSMAECLAAGNFSDDCEHYHTGNYYNWTAAIASNDSSSMTLLHSTAENSVCPAGWRMSQKTSEESGDNNEFQNLFYDSGVITALDSTSYTENGFNRIRSYPLYFARGGYIVDNKLFGLSENGEYSSSTLHYVATLMTLNYNKDFLQAKEGGYRWSGFSVRCLVR